MRYMKESRESGARCIEPTDSLQVLPLHLFVGLADIVCRSFGVVSGGLIEIPLGLWVSSGYFKTHSLVLHGDAGLGKTPLAMSMCSDIADTQQ